MSAPPADRHAGAWLVPHSNGHAGERLLCFPYAGGNPYIFRDWAALLGPAVDVFGVQAPGRGTRMLERPCATVDELVGRLLDATAPMLHERPFSLFGHSNGALLAFEFACQLQRRGLPAPRHVFIAGSPAPWARLRERSYATMTDGEFTQVLRDLQGTPEEILGDAELLRLVLPGLRTDFALSESYRFAHPSPLRADATLLHGDADGFDAAMTEAWRQQLARHAPMHRLSGGHFFIHTHMREVVAIVAATMAAGNGRPAPTDKESRIHA